jgi:uncharacterized protein (DUF2267 family)
MVRKQDLVRSVAEETGQNETQATKAVNAVFSSIEKALASGDEVTLSARLAKVEIRRLALQSPSLPGRVRFSDLVPSSSEPSSNSRPFQR